jgi:hypothetical protein
MPEWPGNGAVGFVTQALHIGWMRPWGGGQSSSLALSGFHIFKLAVFLMNRQPSKQLIASTLWSTVEISMHSSWVGNAVWSINRM